MCRPREVVVQKSVKKEVVDEVVAEEVGKRRRARRHFLRRGCVVSGRGKPFYAVALVSCSSRCCGVTLWSQTGEVKCRLAVVLVVTRASTSQTCSK